ncbi:MAG: hypothetical protein M0Q45_10235 [Bacteroidales bacterium]|jgi:hypothetical protein|nr:hypothetical protein [Bacteroidales bacterium]MCK9499867.1 hypothetical protein [Bacteroidales bacterium]MDY0315226.1 hypothetical protein [Bacteroidales bacterium]
MIWKVLKNNIKPAQLIGTFFGIMLGSGILMLAFAFYLDVKPIFEDKESFWRDEYIIVNKKIKLSDSYLQIKNIDSEKPYFTEEEIKDIKKQDFVKGVAEFTNCSFGINASVDNDSPLSGFSTDLFFEAVPDDYVDVNYENWNWKAGDNYIPVILPKVYLNLYNFGFAQSQNLPQISEGGASLAKFNIYIYGQNKLEKFEARIVGFSERINTILAPKSFVDWGNENFGKESKPKPGRIIIIAKDPSSSELIDYVNKHDYDINKSELSNSKALAFLKIIIGIVVTIGIIIICLTFALIILSIQLLLQRNNENITKLNMLGYSQKEIALPYKLMLSILFALSFLSSLIPLYFFRNYYYSNLVLFGYESSSQILVHIIFPALILNFIVVLLLIGMLKSIIKKIILT